MEERTTVTLRQLDPATAAQLWQVGRQSADWPYDRHDEAVWQARQSELAAAEVFGWGCGRAVEETGECIGFCTLQAVDPAVQPAPRAVECGTWLVPAARGRGFNREVKLALLDLAFSGQVLSRPEWCLFLLHPDNARARESLLKMKLPWVVEDSRDVRNGQLFRQLLRRRAWETGQPTIAIAVERTAYVKSLVQAPLTDQSP